MLNDSLKDLRLIREGLKKQVQMEFIKENEEKLDTILEKLLEEEILGDDNTTTDEPETVEPTTKEVDVDKTETGDGGVESNVDFIDNILSSINIDDVLKTSDIEAQTIDIDTEDKPTTIKIDSDGGVDIKSDEITNDSKEIDYTEDTEEESVNNDETELEEFYNKLNNKTTNNDNMEIDNNTSLDDNSIEKMMEEIEKDLTSIESTEKEPETCSDEETLIYEFENMSEEELDALINEIDVPELDEPVADETTVDYTEDELEEGMSAVSQTKKTVGTSTASTIEGRPERRSNMSEADFLSLKENVEKLLKVNKELKEKNTELKNINESQTKRLDNVKKKLYEATVMSHKVANVNQLFLENSLNQKEKSSILESFMKVETLDESRQTLKTLSEQFSDKKILKESIEDKITKTTIQSGAGVLNETKMVYGSMSQVEKMKELINYKSKS